MKILITGATGMLGRALVHESCDRGYETIGVARSGTDLSLDLLDDAAVFAALSRENPDVVINAAAVIEFSVCEGDWRRAWGLNARAVSVLGEACNQNGAKLVQVSTDHYFTGDGDALHNEDAAVTLLNEYARTKFAGEELALVYPRALVVRTNVTGPRNGVAPFTFFEWCVDLIKGDKEATLFEDYFASTLSAFQLSSLMFDLIACDATGRLNVACREVASKRQFVEALARAMNVRLSRVTGGSVRNLPLKRAESAGLDVSKAEHLLGRTLPTLEEVVADLASRV